MYIVLLIIFAFILPPLAVFLKSGLNFDFFINIMIFAIGLFLIAFVDFQYGGFIASCHAVWVILLSER